MAVKHKIRQYLEEYARRLADDIENLREQERKDGNTEAGFEAEMKTMRMNEIRRLILLPDELPVHRRESHG